MSNLLNSTKERSRKLSLPNLAEGKYILIDKIPVPEPNLLKWGKWLQTPGVTRIAETKLKTVRISTVFLGLDYSMTQGEPILFETMIFGGKHHGYQERYSTYEQAEEGHKKAVQKCLSKR